MAINAVSAEYLAGIASLTSLGVKALTARHEEEFLEHLVTALRELSGGDVVALSLTEPYVHGLIIATEHGVYLPSSGVPCCPDAAGSDGAWLPPEGVFWERVDGQPLPQAVSDMVTAVRPLGVVSAFAAPLPCHADVCGRVLFGWSTPVQPRPEDLRFLRALADSAGVVTGLFQLRRAHDADPLTGLLNRAGLRRRWEQCLEAPFGALIFADLDDFKGVNDTHGHLAGDEVLRETARIFRKVCGRRSILARYGGDEIVVLVPMAGAEEADGIVSALRREFHRSMAHLADPVPRISLGVAWWPHDGMDLESLIDRADRRMYQRKREQSCYAADHLPWSFLQRWLAYSEEGVLLLDPQLRVVYVNRGYERLAGVTLDECVGRVPDLLAWAAGTDRVQAVKEQVNAQRVFVAPTYLCLPGGRETRVYLRVAPVWDDDGRLLGYLGLVHKADDGEATAVPQGNPLSVSTSSGRTDRRRRARERSRAADHPGPAQRLTVDG